MGTSLSGNVAILNLFQDESDANGQFNCIQVQCGRLHTALRGCQLLVKLIALYLVCRFGALFVKESFLVPHQNCILRFQRLLRLEHRIYWECSDMAANKYCEYLNTDTQCQYAAVIRS